MSEKRLKSIAEHEAERRRARVLVTDPYRPTGVACPKCGEELLGNTLISLTSDPPRTPVKCSCGYSGSIVS